MSTVSHVIPVVVIALAVTFMVARLSRRAGWQRARPGRGQAIVTLPGAAQPALRLLPLPGDIGLVAARELRTRVRGRAFRAGTLLVLIIISAAIVVPAVLGGKANIQRVGVAGQLRAPIRSAVVTDGPAAGTRVELVTEPSEQAAAADLRAGRIDLAIVDGRQVVVAKATATSDTSTTPSLARAVARTVGTGEALQAARLTPAQAAEIGRAHV